MAANFGFPNAGEEFVDEQRKITQPWVQFLQRVYAVVSATPAAPAAPTVITPGAGVTFKAPSIGAVVVDGVVATASFKRGGTVYNFGQTTSPFILAKDDELTVTFSTPSTIAYFVPIS